MLLQGLKRNQGEKQTLAVRFTVIAFSIGFTMVKKKGGQVDFTREPLIVTRGSETELVFSVFHNTELSSYMSPKLGVIL